jgi:hypothetical protein
MVELGETISCSLKLMLPLSWRKLPHVVRCYRLPKDLTCLAHPLHTAVEEIRETYPGVDKLISIAKKMLVKAPLRVQKFKQDAPSLSLPLYLGVVARGWMP